MKIPQQIDIPGYAGRYYIRIDGKVFRRLNKGGEKLLNGSTHKTTRLVQYKLKRPDGKVDSRSAGWCMRNTYFTKYPPSVRLMHKNNLKSDYSYWNLKPVTIYELGKAKGYNGTSMGVEKVDPLTGEVIDFYRSVREAGRRNYISATAVSDSIHGKGKKRPGIAPDGFMYKLTKEDDFD